MIHLWIFLSGMLFSAGLAIAEMTRPAKVVNALNILGEWDPSLHLVMAAALPLYYLGYRLIRKRQLPLLADKWRVPTRTDFTPGLFIGALCFGVGWGIIGLCPGPAIADVTSGSYEALVALLGICFGTILSFIFPIEKSQPDSE